MKTVLYNGPSASFGTAGGFDTGTQKELDDVTAAGLLGKPGFSEVITEKEKPKPIKE